MKDLFRTKKIRLNEVDFDLVEKAIKLPIPKELLGINERKIQEFLLLHEQMQQTLKNTCSPSFTKLLSLEMRRRLQDGLNEYDYFSPISKK